MMFTSVLGLVTVEALPGGAPTDACSNLTPSHSGATSQAGDPPFSVDLSAFTGNTYTPGQMYTSKGK